jgi:hypothetical protein
MELIRVKEVRPLHDFVVHVHFTDGSEREIDLERYLHGPVFERIRNSPEAFRQIKVTESRTIGWEDDLDIDPDTLYYDLTPAWAEESELELAK